MHMDIISIAFCASFLHHGQLVDFNCCLSESKSLQIIRNLLGILGDLNEAVVWIALILPLVSSFTSPIFNSFRTFPHATTTITIIVIMFPCDLVLWQGPCIYLSLSFFDFQSMIQSPNSKAYAQ